MKKLFVCLVLVGCGGDDGGGSPVALDQFGPELANASCSKIFECCTDAEIMAQFMGITQNDQPITTEAQCVDFTNGFISGFAVPNYKASIAMGRLGYDADAVGACIAFIESLSCSEYASGNVNAMASGCRPFLIPKVGDGGGCTQDYECTSDNCVGATVQPGGPNTDGTCEPMPTAGQACQDNCTDGYYCGYEEGSTMEVCLALRANGAMCTSDRQCMTDNCDDAMHVCAAKPLVCDGR